MTEGRNENLNLDGDGEAPKGQLQLGEYKLVTGYVGFFGEGNTDGDVIEKEGLVLRKPKWFGTDLSKDDLGVRVLVAVPKADMPQPEPDLNVGALEREVAELKAQVALPLTSGDIVMLRALLGKQKTEAENRDKRSHEDALLNTLDEYLNPKLPFNMVATPGSSDSEADDGDDNEEGSSNPEADDEQTEE